jgi:hypothetical protein
MHGGNQSKAILNATLLKAGLYLWCDVYKATAGGEVKPELFSEGFHSYLMLNNFITSKILLYSY